MARYKPWSGFGPLGRSRALLVYHSLDMKRDGEPSSLRQRKTESPAKNEKEQRYTKKRRYRGEIFRFSATTKKTESC